MFEARARVVERRGWAWAALAIAMVGQLWIATGGQHFSLPLVLALLGLFGISLIGAVAQMRARGRHAVIRTEGTVVTADGKTLVSRGAIASAYVRPGEGNGTCVQMKRRLWPFTIDCDFATDDEAQRFLHAIGFGIDQRTADFRARLPMVEHTWSFLGATALFGLAALILSATGHDAPKAFFPVYLASMSILNLVLQQGRLVRVGADGIIVRSLRNRFVPFSEVEAITTRHDADHELVIVMKNGPNITLSFARKTKWSNGEHPVAALAARLRDAMAGSSATGTRIHTTALLARGGRDVAAWAREVRRLGDETNARYRVAAVPPEDLWRIVEDTSAGQSERVGAAAALHGRLDDGGRARLRVASEATAAPQLRVALKQIAAASLEDDEALEAALARVVE